MAMFGDNFHLFLLHLISSSLFISSVAATEVRRYAFTRICDRPFRPETNTGTMLTAIMDSDDPEQNIMLGKIVERRDEGAGACLRAFHRFLYLRWLVQVNKGPFLRERGMYPLKLFATATYDEFISTLVAAGLLAAV